MDEVTNLLFAESLLKCRIHIRPDLFYAKKFGVELNSDLPIVYADGKYYSYFGLIEPLLIACFISFASMVGIAPWTFTESLLHPIITVATVCPVFLAARRFLYFEKSSFLLSVIYGFSTFASTCGGR